MQHCGMGEVGGGARMTTVGIPALPARLAQRYEVGPVIGRGVGSSVFRAHDTLLGRDAAVKTFRVETDARARRELTLLAMMDHPGLVPVYDVEEHDGRAFVVMALLDGGSLADRLGEHGPESGGLALTEALRTAGTVAGALDHIHRAGVLHRDVTPANVLYDADGRAHLSDFGVAFVADAPRITDTGLTVGAAPYLAPEQVRGEPAGAPADVYALGLVLIEALTGRRAFPGDPLSAAQARLDREPTVPAGLPGPLAELIAAMTRSDPATRPGAAEVSVGLRQALVDAEPLVDPLGAHRPGGHRSGRADRDARRAVARDPGHPPSHPAGDRDPRRAGPRGSRRERGARRDGRHRHLRSGRPDRRLRPARRDRPRRCHRGRPGPERDARPAAARAAPVGRGRRTHVGPRRRHGRRRRTVGATPTSHPAPVHTQASPTRDTSTARPTTKHTAPSRTTTPTRDTDERHRHRHGRVVDDAAARGCGRRGAARRRGARGWGPRRGSLTLRPSPPGSGPGIEAAPATARSWRPTPGRRRSPTGRGRPAVGQFPAGSGRPGVARHGGPHSPRFAAAASDCSRANTGAYQSLRSVSAVTTPASSAASV